MRIIYLHQYFNTPQMAGGTRSYEIARHLVARGHTVHMVTADRQSTDGPDWRETDEDGIHVHWCRVSHLHNASYARRLRGFLRFAWLAARKAASLPGDLVFATSTPLTIAIPAVYAARRKRAPMVFEVRDLWPEVPIAMGALKNPLAIGAARWLERFAYRHAQRVITLSPGMTQGVVATGYPADRVTMIPNMCDTARFSVDEGAGLAFRAKHPWLQDRPLVVYTGALGYVNGVDYLARLAAAAWLHDPDVRFLVVGSDREEANIRRVARQLGVLERNFFMLPSVPKSEIPAILSAADLATNLVVPIDALAHNSANKAFDALAAGRPLATNLDRGWIADLIRQTGCGLVLDPRDLDRAAVDLVEALRDPAWRTRSRAAARHVAQEQFDRDKLVVQWEEAVLGVIRTEEQTRGNAEVGADRRRAA